MNFEKLTKKERRIALEVMHEFLKALHNNDKDIDSLKTYLSLDFDVSACEETLDDLLEFAKHLAQKSERFDTVRNLLHIEHQSSWDDL